MSFMVNSHRFAASSDVVLAVQDFDTGTTTGAQSFTSTTITGVTPKAVLVIVGLHESANDPNETVGGSWSLGMVDAAGDNALRGQSRDNIANTAVSCELSGSAVELRNNGGTAIKIAAGSMVSGGVSLNFSTNSAPSLRSYFVAFAGADAQAHQNVVGLGTGTSAIDVTAPGFEPSAVIAMTSGFAVNSNNTPLRMSFGIATSDGTQRCVMWVEDNVVLAGGTPFQTLRTDCIAGANNATTGALAYKVTAGSFDASGFSVTPSASTTNADLAYLAMDFATRQCKIVDFTTPTSTGSSTITGAGFTPTFALAVLTNLETLDDHPGATSDLQSGFSICAIGDDEQWSASFRLDSGADPTDTASQVSNVAIMGASATDCDAIKATFTAWTNDGVTVNYSAVQGTGKKGFVLFVQ